MAVLTVQLSLLALLLALSGFFSGAEVALISITNAKVERMIRHKRIGAVHVRRLKANPQRMLSTILIGNNLANIAAASLTTVVMLGLFREYAVGIATGIMTFLILIFGEITPKSIASQHAERFAQLAGPPVYLLSLILKPVLALLDGFLKALLKLLGVKAGNTHVTEEEIRYLVTTAEREGSIDEHEKSLIHNVFELDETSVGEIITPRTDMVCISDEKTVGDALRLISKERFSRIPVFHKQKDHIIGILNLRDLLDCRRRTPVTEVMVVPHVVPEHKKVSDMIREFQKRKEHLALVVDEYGTLLGLVTLEDALEEIVGEIVDEAETATPNIVREGKVWIVKGNTEVEELEKKTRLRLPRGDYETVSGFLLAQMGRIPGKGEEFRFKRRRFIIDAVRGNRIRRIRIE